MHQPAEESVHESLTRWVPPLLFAVAVLGCGSDGSTTTRGAGAACPPTEDQLGCLPCEDGWHAGIDGACHADCPATLKEDDDGVCRVAVCPEGARELAWTEQGVPLWKSCLAACPAGMVERGEGLARTCHIPCTGPWVERPDGTCRRDCPAGMHATGEDGMCELDQAGERKSCPPGLYDDSFAGPNPLYVDASSTITDPNGTKAAPFPTMSAALAASGDEVTLYLAAGTYKESVRSEGRSVVNVIGACADRVKIVVDDLVESAEAIPAAVEVVGARTATVQGVSVTSNLRGIRVVCDDDPEATVLIADNRVERTGYTGVAARGVCSVEVRDNTIRNAQGASIILAEADLLSPSLRVLVSGNDIAEMDDCTSSSTCVDVQIGVLAFDLAKLEASRNRIADLQSGTGISLANVVASVVEDNVIRGITGNGGVLVSPAPGGDTGVRRNEVFDGVPGPVASDQRVSFHAINVYRVQSSTVSIEANRITDIGGSGITVEGLGPSEIRGNDIRGAFLGLWVEGDMRVADNRAAETQLAFVARNTNSVFAHGNVLADTVAKDFGLLPGSSLSELVDGGNNVGVTLAGPESVVAFEGNEVADCHGPGAAMLVSTSAPSDGSESVLIRDNVFRSNVGMDLYIEGGAKTVLAGNRFSGDAIEPAPAPDAARVGVLIGDGASGSPTDVAVTNNYFQDYRGGHAIYLASDAPGDSARWTVDDNLFVDSGMVRIRAGAQGSRVTSLLRNHAAFTALVVSGVDQVAVEQNALFYSLAFVEDTPPSGTVSLHENVAFLSNLALSHVAAPSSIANNHVVRGLGYGVAVASSAGPVGLFHNLVTDTESHTWEGIGDVGDGIHVTGSADLGASSIEARGNLISGSARLGLLVSGSAGTVEGNSFVGNGCGRACQFVVQSEPGFNAVKGGDEAFASRPASRYGAISSEDL